jgi:putative tryptophan/tyrosine transport system substrate-binding protein
MRQWHSLQSPRSSCCAPTDSRMIDRRTLLSAFALLPVLSLPGAHAQQQRSWRVGFLALPARPESLETSRFGAFPLGMRELGYIEGRNLSIEWRFAGGDVARLDELAADLVQRKVDVIVAGATPVISAAQRATATIPIVMAASNDPVGSGFVDNLGRPGHNITGVSLLSADLSAKAVEMLLSIVPTAARIAILVNPRNSSNAAIAVNLQVAMQGVRTIGLPVEATTADSIDEAFAKMKRQDVGALVVAADTFFVEQRERIAEHAIRQRLPSMFSFREHVQAGGLISYGQHLADSYRRAATYVERIFKGAKLAELPVELSTKLELVVNLRTAKTLGLSLPPRLVAIADEVIE